MNGPGSVGVEKYNMIPKYNKSEILDEGIVNLDD